MASIMVLLAGFSLLAWGAADVGTPPSPPPGLPPLLCPMLGPGGTLSPRPALLRLWGGTETPPDSDPPEDQDPDMTFDVIDPWGTLAEAWAPPRGPPRCELSPTVPVATPPAWAPSLARAARSPPGLGGSWWVLTLGTPRYGVTTLLHGRPRPRAPTRLNASLSVLTRRPELVAPRGSPLELPCSFAGPPGPFALEWRHQHRGSGRRLLAYDSGAARGPAEAAEGARLLLGPPGGELREVSLRLDALDVAHRGTYVCSVFLPHGQTQQLLHLRVLAPPKVTVRPTPLVVAEGAAAELLCETSGYFPLDVRVRWRRRAGPSGPPLPLGDAVAETWSSGHRRGPDGTFSRSSGVRLVPARPRHHGDIYTCVVTHEALGKPLRVPVRLQVVGAGWPGVEDVVGLFLVAFVLCGLWRWLSPAPSQPDQDPKQKSQ